MESNEILRGEIFKIITNQLKANKPPETKQALNRLREHGYSDLDAKKFIGQCIAVELFHVLKHRKPFDESRYISNLKKLPEEPFDDLDKKGINPTEMIDTKFKEIRNFCILNSKPENVLKYSRYFKEGFDGYGIEQKTYENQRDQWIEEWKGEMTLELYLDLGDQLMQSGKYEEKSFAIAFVKSQRENYNKNTFERIGKWFDYGISNWATTDVLCMLVLSSFLIDKIISFNELKEWTNSQSEWKRRVVPVTLVELIKKDLKPSDALPLIEPLMPDKSEYVQKGIGTLLRGLWKKHPKEIEDFLFKWKDKCGRLIIQYATEKMDKEYRKKFSKQK